MTNNVGNVETLIAGIILGVGVIALCLTSGSWVSITTKLENTSSLDILLEQRLNLLRAKIAQSSAQGYLRQMGVKPEYRYHFNPPVSLNLNDTQLFAAFFGVNPEESLQFQEKTVFVSYQISLGKYSDSNGEPIRTILCNENCSLSEIDFIHIRATAKLNDTSPTKLEKIRTFSISL